MKPLSSKRFLVLVTGLSLLTACTPTLKIEKLERLVKQDFATQTGIAVKAVTCPQDIKLETNHSFDCEIKAEDGKALKVKVTQKDSAGNVKWTTNEGLIPLATVEQSIQESFQQQKETVTADCGGKFKIAFQGDTFNCSVQDAKDQPQEVEVTITDRKGSTIWKPVSS
ncbi:MAG: DUF4333 domain-containing protein [Thermosynechococcaceae cyanobacterium]